MNARSRFILPAGVFMLGAGLMALGIWRDELSVILQKAVVVCLECIGIG